MNRTFLRAALVAAAALGFTSCAYDPYYTSSSTTVGGSYSSGYGDGYGYGGSTFTTSVFVSTGDPRWGYDPYCYSYYDYRRRCYYDPYLNGYYPIGYRPPVVYGVPHPYGWHRGRPMPPPRGYRDVRISHYRDRESAYRNSNYSWARQVRQGPPRQSDHRPPSSRPGSNTRPDNAFRPPTSSRPDSSFRPPTSSRPGHSQRPPTSSRPPQGSSGNHSRPQAGGTGIPSRYNTPVRVSDAQQGRSRNPGAQAPRQASSRQEQGRRHEGRQGSSDKRGKDRGEENRRY